MFRPTSRLIACSYAPRSFHRVGPARRFLSTVSSTQQSRSWKSSAVRWGLALGLVYYYNTSSVFAEEPAYTASHIPETEQETETLPTIESISAQRRQRNAQVASTPVNSDHKTTSDIGQADAAPGSVEELEEEADQQGAFNPETGEINWDCPCLGGMAHGPCGEEFKAAFSCFVYSTEDPKGMDCIDKFKGMQDCFRQHPDIYGAELDDGDDMTVDERSNSTGPETVAASSPEIPLRSDASSPIMRAEKVADDKPQYEPSPERELQAKRKQAQAATGHVKREHEPQSESNEVIPRAWHDEAHNEKRP
ncbi:hypothetical protein AOQ84DRAFT_352202 [Glonium stellatum]|uniref:Mitochondrial intermembrane space import and assembly protein 40 n=1 Tax=Glonium stellatum TaxID=574774 RepID=A0A8E2F9G9_9PEZI|nr:hypothetical protein AOQ84DRAFT_352202 [Glonium stellatum]